MLIQNGVPPSLSLKRRTFVHSYQRFWSRSLPPKKSSHAAAVKTDRLGILLSPSVKSSSACLRAPGRRSNRTKMRSEQIGYCETTCGSTVGVAQSPPPPRHLPSSQSLVDVRFTEVMEAAHSAGSEFKIKNRKSVVIRAAGCNEAVEFCHLWHSHSEHTHLWVASE